MIRVQFQGGKELAAALKQLPARVSKRVTLEVLHEVAEPMADLMSTLAPRGNPAEPNLYAEIGVMTSRGQDAQESAVAIGPSKRAFYGSFQELGTTRHSAKPFVRPAFDEKAPSTLRDMAKAFWRELSGRGISRPTVNATTHVQGEV